MKFSHNCEYLTLRASSSNAISGWTWRLHNTESVNIWTMLLFTSETKGLGQPQSNGNNKVTSFPCVVLPEFWGIVALQRFTEVPKVKCKHYLLYHDRKQKIQLSVHKGPSEASAFERPVSSLHLPSWQNCLQLRLIEWRVVDLLHLSCFFLLYSEIFTKHKFTKAAVNF